MFNQPQIAPSILAADILNLESDVAAVVNAGAKILHIDIMDGSFVPAITFGANVVAGLRQKFPDTILDVHLMIENPQNHVETFAAAGSDFITVHYEAIVGRDDPGTPPTSDKLIEIANEIRQNGAKAGISINPATPVSAIRNVIEHFDLALIMTVVPGLGGQKYIDDCTAKIAEVAELSDIIISVDGGVNADTISIPAAAGANILVAGNAIFAADNIAAAFEELRQTL